MATKVKRLNTIGNVADAIQKVAFIKNIQATNVDGHAASNGSYAIAEFNTLTGNTSFIQLISNQIILQPGTYQIDGTIPYTRTLAASGSSFHKAKLVNVSGPVDILLGSSATQALSTAGYRDQVYSFLKGTITITSTTTFEIHQRSSTAGVIGYAVSYGDNEVYAQVKITKIETLSEAY
jgi:hypothetical protein